MADNEMESFGLYDVSGDDVPGEDLPILNRSGWVQVGPTGMSDDSELSVTSEFTIQTSTVSELKDGLSEQEYPNLTDWQGKALLVQTNILLMVVIFLCLIIIMAVCAVCICIHQKYRHDVTSQAAFRTTLLTKSTSISGLHLADERFLTKMEKLCDSSFQTQCSFEYNVQLMNNGRCGPLNESEGAAKPLPPPAPPLVATSPVSCAREEKATSVCFDVPPVFITSSPLPNTEKGPALNIETSDMRSSSEIASGQSVSWFVPLDGVQREPLRHSVVDLMGQPDVMSLG